MIDFTSKRIQKVCVSNITSKKTELCQGVPQGTILGPLLFDFYVNDMRQNIAPICQNLQYVDDTMLYLTNEDFNMARSDIEKCLSDYIGIFPDA